MDEFYNDPFWVALQRAIVVTVEHNSLFAIPDNQGRGLNVAEINRTAKESGAEHILLMYFSSGTTMFSIRDPNGKEFSIQRDAVVDRKAAAKTVRDVLTAWQEARARQLKKP